MGCIWRCWGCLTDVIVRLLSVLIEKAWWLEKVPDSWKKITIKSIFTKAKGGSGELLVCPTLVSVKIIEYIHLDSIYKHMKDRNVVRSSRHGNTQGIMLQQPDCLLWWNDYVDEGGVLNAIYLVRLLTPSPTVFSVVGWGNVGWMDY